MAAGKKFALFSMTAIPSIHQVKKQLPGNRQRYFWE
jgi:hypothetical protein